LSMTLLLMTGSGHRGLDPDARDWIWMSRTGSGHEDRIRMSRT
jgi:hypothetical protein